MSLARDLKLVDDLARRPITAPAMDAVLGSITWFGNQTLSTYSVKGRFPTSAPPSRPVARRVSAS